MLVANSQQNKRSYPMRLWKCNNLSIFNQYTAINIDFFLVLLLRFTVSLYGKKAVVRHVLTIVVRNKTPGNIEYETRNCHSHM